MTLGDLDPNESTQHEQWAAGYDVSKCHLTDAPYLRCVAIWLAACLKRNDRLSACYWLGRLMGAGVNPYRGESPP